VQAPGRQLYLVPHQVAQLHSPQAMPEGDQDHGGVAVGTVSPGLPGHSHQALDLANRQILARPN
jgi:hypothetical protein